MAIFFCTCSIIILKILFSTCSSAPLPPTPNQIKAGADLLDHTIKFILRPPTSLTALENHGVCPLVRIHGYFQAMQNLTEHGYQNTSVIVLLAKNLAETSCEYMKNDSCNGDEYCSMNCNISSISQLCMQADIGAKIRKYRNATIGNVNTGSVLPEEYATWLNQIPADEYTDVILAKVNNTLNRLGYSCSYYQRFSCTDV